MFLFVYNHLFVWKEAKRFCTIEQNLPKKIDKFSVINKSTPNSN